MRHARLPTPGRGFEWYEGNCGPVLRCTTLAPVASHVFTTRGLDLRGTPPSDAAGWEAVARELRVLPEDLIGIRQVHGRAIATRRRGVRSAPSPTDGDGLATDDPRLAVAVVTADCVPILLADDSGRTVAAVHAGWRGTAAGVATAAVQTLVGQFGVEPASLRAALGPSIGPCCYVVGADVRRRFETAIPSGEERWFGAGPGSRLVLDLRQANRDLLVSAGLRPDRIVVAQLCTACHHGLLESYRVQGARAGRTAAVIRAGGAPGS